MRRCVWIEGLDAAGQLDDVEVFCAGVGADAEGRLVTAGGRVLGVVGFGDGVGVARERAYAGIGEIRWSGMQYRTDIAAAALSGGA